MDTKVWVTATLIYDRIEQRKAMHHHYAGDSVEAIYDLRDGFGEGWLSDWPMVDFWARVPENASKFDSLKIARAKRGESDQEYNRVGW